MLAGRCHGCALSKRHFRSLSYTSAVLQRKCPKSVTPLVLHIGISTWKEDVEIATGKGSHGCDRSTRRPVDVTQNFAQCVERHIGQRCCAQRRRQTSNTSNNRRWNVQRRRQSSTGHTQPQTMRTRNRNSSPNPRIHSRRGGVPARNCRAKKISL